MQRNAMKFIDIGANLTDSMYKGLYHGSKKHDSDLSDVLLRSWDSGLEKLIITGGSLEESHEALQLAQTSSNLYCTVGCHPTRCDEFEKSSDPDKYLKDLTDLVTENKEKVVAIGECGLDYDRLHFCKKEVQLKYFEKQLPLSKIHNKPLFLHCRNCFDDFYKILNDNRDKFTTGVVHSFDGPLSYANKFIELGLYIGINGCSLKTEENLSVVKEIPSDKIMIETDCPWCEIKPTHAGYKYISTKFPSVKKEKWSKGSMIKGRNEPCTIVQVLEIIAGLKEENINKLSEQIFKNTVNVFFTA
uniref:Deoxyribonuclease TATDN1 n=1 Tax=Riptortus pedestris TaxID=329032 RepID=R4WJX6_RIPPE|nr:conserved hypothetical protein [Riptortus pedestris]